MCCPQEHYDGLKVSKVSILKPTYYQQEEGTPSIEELNNLLLGCDFNKFEFLPLKQSNLKQFTNFPMLNYALTNTYVINPANFKLFSGTQGLLVLVCCLVQGTKVELQIVAISISNNFFK